MAAASLGATRKNGDLLGFARIYLDSVGFSAAFLVNNAAKTRKLAGALHSQTAERLNEEGGGGISPS
jgi:hypothetical protein